MSNVQPYFETVIDAIAGSIKQKVAGMFPGQFGDLLTMIINNIRLKICSASSFALIIAVNKIIYCGMQVVARNTCTQ